MLGISLGSDAQNVIEVFKSDDGVELSGLFRVVSVEEGGRFELEALSRSNGLGISCEILVNDRLSLGDVVYLNAKYFYKEIPVTLGSFNFQKYNLRKGRLGKVEVCEIREVGELDWKGAILRKREALHDDLQSRFEDDGLGRAMFSALILGDNTLIKPCRKVFTTAGVAHVLAISGAHIGMLFWVLCLVFRLLPKRGWLRVVKVLGVVSGLWFFVFLSGFGVSAVRAVAMCSLYWIAQVYLLKIKLPSILGLVGVVSVVLEPMVVYDIGFQLSYIAVLGISVFFSFFKSLYPTKRTGLKLIIDSVCLSLSAQIAVLPLCLYYFHLFPSYFLVSNLISIPFLFVLLSVGFVVVLLVSAEVSEVFTEIFSLVSDLFFGIIKLVSEAPFSPVRGIHISAVEVLIWYVAIIAIGFGIIKRVKLLLLFGLLAIACGLIVDWREDVQLPKTVFLFSGYGDKKFLAVSNSQRSTVYAFQKLSSWDVTKVKNLMDYYDFTERLSMVFLKEGECAEIGGNSKFDFSGFYYDNAQVSVGSIVLLR